MKRSVLILLVVLLAACQEEPVLTQGQVMARRLSADVQVSLDVETTKYTVWVTSADTNSTLFTANSLKITADGFVEARNGTASSVVFNLEFLKSYQISGGNLYLYL
jgi:hypothetical protein